MDEDLCGKGETKKIGSGKMYRPFVGIVCSKVCGMVGCVIVAGLFESQEGKVWLYITTIFS